MEIIGKKILVLTAHPDDESYFASGLLYLNKKNGGQTFMICATLGEKGKSHLKKTVTDKQLMVIRKKELFAAAKFLGIKKINLLGLNDGKLKFQAKIFYESALPLVKRVNPDYILSFGNDGISGHLDHVTTAKVALKISKKFHIPLVKFAVSPYISKNGLKWFKLRRSHSNYSKQLLLPTGNLKIASPKGVKLKAMRFYPSQIEGKDPFTHYPPKAIKDMVGAEYFIV